MTTDKAHQRFWEAMRARFGLRWITEFGEAPTAPWIQLLKAYTPDVIKRALELMVEQKPAHPPTLPQFEAILQRAAHKHDGESAQDWTRRFWLSVVVDASSRELFVGKAITRVNEFDGYLRTHRELGQTLKALVDELCDLERHNNGVRTSGLQDHGSRQCTVIIRAHLATQGVAA